MALNGATAHTKKLQVRMALNGATAHTKKLQDFKM
jgi:hypothetical protein